MKLKKIIVGAVAATAIAGGTAGAIAATSGGKEAEQAVLADAAKRLDVTPGELRSALGGALDAQLDAEVKAGRLTQEQADAIKERRQQEGTVLGFGHRGGPHGPGHFRGPGLIEDVADALGISTRELFERLHDGRTLAQIAKAEGRTLAEVKATLREKLEADKDLTDAQRDALLDHLDDLGRRPPRFGHGGPGHHFRGGPPPRRP